MQQLGMSQCVSLSHTHTPEYVLVENKTKQKKYWNKFKTLQTIQSKCFACFYYHHKDTSRILLLILLLLILVVLVNIIIIIIIRVIKEADRSIFQCDQDHADLTAEFLCPKW